MMQFQKMNTFFAVNVHLGKDHGRASTFFRASGKHSEIGFYVPIGHGMCLSGASDWQRAYL